MKDAAPGRATVLLQPAVFRGGRVTVPGDKSISHRIAMLAALSHGVSTVHHFLRAGDCLSTVQAMEALGARSSFNDDDSLSIEGTGGKLMEPAGPLDLGNSGTSIRLLAGLVAGFPVTVEMTGDASLRARPMQRIREPLERMGAGVELLGPGGCAPVRIRGGRLRGIEYRLPVASAQVKSCVLLAGLLAEGRTVVVEPAPTRDHTERILQTLGVPLETRGGTIALEGGNGRLPHWPARAWRVPGDFSSAAYWLVAAAIHPGKSVTVPQVGLNPRRTALLDVLRRMGAVVAVAPSAAGPAEEPCGNITVTGQALRGTEIGGDEIPNLIDELPLVAVLGACAEGRTVIRDAAELRVKESDRIASMATNLRALGVPVEEQPDGMILQRAERVGGAHNLRSFGDHRIAMAMAILALRAAQPVTLSQVACVDTSYPEFWAAIRSLGGHVE